MDNFNKYFDLAIKQAYKAFYQGDVPVGCVIVNKYNGNIIAKSCNLSEYCNNSIMHAEITTINKASKKIGKNLSDCIAFVTLSPCIMCATAFTYTRIDSVYYCALNPKLDKIDKCQFIRDLDKNLYKTRFCFIENNFTKISETLLKDFFKNIRILKK